MSNMGEITAKTTGGSKTREFLRRAKAAARSGQPTLKVGFFETARYPDGTPVAAVAAWNEFGTRSRNGTVLTPERPSFRNSLPEMKEQIANVAKGRIDPATMEVTETMARLMGTACEGVLKKSITKLSDPPNAPGTVRAKGSSNPLIDRGFMRMSASHEVER